MKKDIHPDYRYVVFQDVSANFSFLTKSTIKTKKTIEWEDGKEYPLVNVDISSQSHPFYTGKARLLDAAGRVEKFRRKFGSYTGAMGAPGEAPAEEPAEEAPAEEAPAEEAPAEEAPADAPAEEAKSE